MNEKRRIGYTCAYTPLALIHAAGFSPYRILPDVDCADRAGQVLHDNLCPHVKRVLDRAMAGSVPELAGAVFMNSCDAMRRLADAWAAVRRDVPAALVDLPVVVNDRTVSFFRDELERCAGILQSWGGVIMSDASIAEGVGTHNRIAERLERLRALAREGRLPGGFPALQEAYNLASTAPPEEAIARLDHIESGALAAPSGDGVPVFVFGNVLPEPEAFTLFEDAGARVVGEDLCTGSRLFARIDAAGPDPLRAIASSLLGRTACARTFDAEHPGGLAETVVTRAREFGARAVIAYTAKFCDPYIARMPAVRDALRTEGIPFLALEGDCTLRSIGQHRTRLEAFIEMMR
ncbi:MAG TPA: 2-hydroxyacyl-CoA dehydratase family protein [Spirochaetota bacterium]|nr:2-hydroxyacyl-CoA dehydratase family protein [Spirochaetota bacterium]HNT12776.1 2-hydroxyacyl-CoA dehydratase family protein [Spirochaetota bacterium]